MHLCFAKTGEDTANINNANLDDLTVDIAHGFNRLK